MKITIVSILGVLLLGCASTENEVRHSDDYLTNISNEHPVLHRDKAGIKEAFVGVALATTIGALTKDSFKCEKECEDELKRSIAEKTKK